MERTFRYIGVSAIILLLIGLLGWFFFLRNETSQIVAQDKARGFSIGIPSFLGARGSSAGNIESGIDANNAELSGSTSGSGFSLSSLIGFLTPRAQPGVGAPTSQNASTSPSVVRIKIVTQRLWRISGSPIAGANFITASSTMLRYVERATGYIFDVDPDTGETARLSNTLIPKVYAATIGSTALIFETLDDTATKVVTAVRMSTTTEDGFHKLERKNLGAVDDVVLTAGDDVVRSVRDINGGVHIIRSLWDGSKPKELGTLPGGNFLITPVDARIILTERSASSVAGNAYTLTSSLTPLIRGVAGLQTLTRSGSNMLLYSEDGADISLFMRQGASTTAIRIPLRTVAEKCVMGTNRIYCAVPETIAPGFLNEWYRGNTHTNDVWYVIPTSGGEPEKVFAPQSALGIDVEEPALDASGEHILFINARDKSLWVFRIAP